MLLLGIGIAGSTAWPGPVGISLDKEVSSTVAAGEEQLFQVAGLDSGQRIYVQRTATSKVNPLNGSLEDAFGRVIEQNSGRLNEPGPVSLSGRLHRLNVRGEIPVPPATSTFSFIVLDVEDTSSALVVDAPDTWSLSAVGATHAFALDSFPWPTRQAHPPSIGSALTQIPELLLPRRRYAWPVFP